MNALAAAPGWRDLAIWVMPSAVYALASDTLIGVIRAWVIATTRHTGQTLADDEATPMALVGGMFLWLLRLALAPMSRSAGSAAGRSTNPIAPAARPRPRRSALPPPTARRPPSAALDPRDGPAAQASRTA